MIGTEAVARAAPDGETVLLTNPAFLINPHIKKVGYDPLTNFDPVCNIVNFPLVFVVPADSPLKTMADMIAMAKAKPGSVTVASAGTGNPTHIGFEVLKAATGLEMTYVPFAGRGARRQCAARRAYHVGLFRLHHRVRAVEGGRAAAARGRLADSASPGCRTCRPSPSSATPPTKRKAGTACWRRPKTPKDTLAQLEGWFTAAGRSPELKEKLGALGILPEGRVRRGLRRQPRRQYEHYGSAIRASKLKVE